MKARERDLNRDRRAYTLTNESLPVYVGEEMGSLTYEEAVELSILRRIAQGLPADRDFVTAIAPPHQDLEGDYYGHDSEVTSYTPRGSKNSPYVCIHCTYKSTRYSNMKAHLRNRHGDDTTDPRECRA